MADVTTRSLQGLSAFGATRLGQASATTFKDAGSLVSALFNPKDKSAKDALDVLKLSIKKTSGLVSAVANAVDTQTAVIADLAKSAIADAGTADFTVAVAGRIAVRIGKALHAMDEAI